MFEMIVCNAHCAIYVHKSIEIEVEQQQQNERDLKICLLYEIKLRKKMVCIKNTFNLLNCL